MLGTKSYLLQLHVPYDVVTFIFGIDREEIAQGYDAQEYVLKHPSPTSDPLQQHIRARPTLAVVFRTIDEKNSRSTMEGKALDGKAVEECFSRKIVFPSRS
jgi:hypothetical protein